MKKNAWKIFLVAAVVLFGLSFFVANQATENADEGVNLTNHLKGNPDAAVVVKEYSDFQCPACGQFYPVVKEVMEEFGDDVSFEYKHFPLITIHPFAVPAAKAAEAAAQQGEFWAMHDKLFENQDTWSKATNPTAFFVQYAEELGLDVETFRRHMRSNLIDDRIQADFNEARDSGFTGTPSFTLNGQKMEFATFEEFRALIDRAVNGDRATTTDPLAPTSDLDVEFSL